MNKQKSFTLIELLVVIVIIGILAGVIMISTSSAIDKANIAKVKVFEESVQNNLAANMVSRWPLDEIININQTPDRWGSNTGTLGDGVTTATYPTLLSESECVSGKCMKFDGVDDYINCPTSSNLDITEAITASAWVKQFSGGGPAGSTRTVSSAGANNKWVFKTGNDGKFIFLIEHTDGSVTYGDPYFDLNEWTFLVGTFNNSKFKVYINGSNPVNKDPTSTGIKSYTNSYVRMGAETQGTFFNGVLDDVRIYNAALSSSQIKQNYIAGLDSLLSKELISKEEYNARIEALSQK